MTGSTQYDIIIVGSGTSGSVVAYNLQKAGAKCLLLEAGKYFRAETFPHNEMDYTAQLFWGGGVDFNTRGTLALLRGRCVGGGSVVNQCLMDRNDDVALADWKAESGIDFFTPEAMAPYYEKAEAQLSLRIMEESDRTRNANLFVEGSEKNGYGWEPLRRGQADCKLDKGNDCMCCLGGCHLDSKQSMLVTYLRRAEELGLDIRPEFMVHRIEHGKDGVVLKGTKDGVEQTLHCKRAVLACGTLGTAQLLFNSGFRAKLPALGTGFCIHPQWMTFGIYDEPVDAHKAAFQTVRSKDTNFRKAGFKLENVFAPPGAVALLFGRTGRPLQEFMKKYRHLSCIEVAVRDEAVGQLSTNSKGRLQINKNLTDQDFRRKEAGLEAVQNIMAEAGAKDVIPCGLSFGLHLMGGCRIGTDERTSVVNEAFEVHGHPNLTVTDMSLYPNAPGINPALTVMALAEKVSEGLQK